MTDSPLRFTATDVIAAMVADKIRDPGALLKYFLAERSGSFDARLETICNHVRSAADPDYEELKSRVTSLFGLPEAEVLATVGVRYFSERNHFAIRVTIALKDGQRQECEYQIPTPEWIEQFSTAMRAFLDVTPSRFGSVSGIEFAGVLSAFIARSER